MCVRLVSATILVVMLSACGGGPVVSPPSSTADASPGGATSAASAGAATGAPIDLSKIDACAIVPEGTAEQLTGETGFTADGSASASDTSCFWGVPRPGVPQYLEVKVFRRSGGLDGYAITPNGVACPGVAVPGVGAEAVGGVCSTDQPKVWLAAMDRGVVVQVIVNVPKGALTPADLADAVNGVIAGLG
jgi:hypothetical protein